ncbi:hypothetical protein PUN28_015111 [Cardiocondyla obscurior]|uniref:Uncharacterized protein n=1 Tax=Cardiocondyla obscurior TaxID=286306 RepID=A0AAW2EYG3_9HYME
MELCNDYFALQLTVAIVLALEFSPSAEMILDERDYRIIAHPINNRIQPYAYFHLEMDKYSSRNVE